MTFKNLQMCKSKSRVYFANSKVGGSPWRFSLAGV
jgi:hypothetical protein